MPVDDQERFITVSAAAAKYKLHPQTIYRLVGQRKLPAVKIGGAVRIDAALVDALNSLGRKGDT